MALQASQHLYYDANVFNAAVSLLTRGLKARGQKPTRFYNACLTVWRRPPFGVQTGGIAAKKNGYIQYDVYEIRIDAEATSISARLSYPAINPMARGYGGRICTQSVYDADGWSDFSPGLAVL